MSRVAKNPITVPKGVDISINGHAVSVKGPKGSLDRVIHDTVQVTLEEQTIKVAVRDEQAQTNALAGTTRALLNNMVHGVTAGFEKSLTLVGVGYRAQAQGKKLNLTLGFSHPVSVDMPDGVAVETPSPTEIKISGIDKQQVGQIAAVVRAFRPPEPYKGKGIRYADEQVRRKEAKKK